MWYYFLGCLHILSGELERNLQQRVHEHHQLSHLVENTIYLREDCYSPYPDATGLLLVLRLCSWSRRTTKSAFEAFLEVVVNVLDACIGRVALKATDMVANIVKAEGKEENPENLIGYEWTLPIPFHPLREAKFEGIIPLSLHLCWAV